MKKLLSIVLTVAMLMSLFCFVPASAAELPENIATDYEADEATQYSGNVLAGTYTSRGIASVGNCAYQNGAWYMNSTDVKVELPVNGNYDHALAGYKAVTNIPAGSTGRVVFKFDVQTTSGKPVINVARHHDHVGSTNPAKVDFPIGTSKDIGLTPGTRYEEMKGVFADTGREPTKYNYLIGFVNGTEPNSQFSFLNDTAYIGFERIYDMDVEASATELYAGQEIEISTEITNQIGEDFGGNSDITWYATDADRTAAVDGFAFAKGENGVYTVSVDNTVAAGTYDIVAVADADAYIVKGIELTVLETPSFDDYAANEETRYSGNVLAGTYTSRGIASVGNCAYQNGAWYMNSTGVKVELPVNGNYDHALAGYKAVTNIPADSTGRVVFKFDVQTTSGKPVINVARHHDYVGSTNPDKVDFPIGTSKDIGLTPGTSYEELKGVFADTGREPTKYNYLIGFVNGTEPNSQFSFLNDTAYIGFERIYDMDVESSATELYAGQEIEVSAEVINQIGEAYVNQGNISWMAMDTERTAAVDGFVFAENEDGTVTVTVGDTVAAGTYDIVAVSDVMEGLIKGVEVTVTKNPYLDYVPDEATQYSGNVLTGSYTSRGIGSVGNCAYQNGAWFMNSTGVKVELPLNGTYDHALAGYKAVTNIPAGSTGRVVFKFDVQTTSGKPVINVARHHDYVGSTNPDKVDFPIGTSKDIGLTPGTSYEELKGVFADTGREPTKYNYLIGFVNGTEPNSQFSFLNDTAYIGFERIYDMEVKAAAETVAQGGTVNVEATVLNQIGVEYGGEAAISWKAMNTDRTAEIDGITIENGVVTVAETVAPGTYDIVAIYGDLEMAKGVSIEVTEAEEEPVIEGISIEKTAGGITVSTDTALSNAMLIFATYEGGRMVSVNIDTKVNLDAQKAQEYPVPANFANAKVMLWTSDFKPLAKALN